MRAIIALTTLALFVIFNHAAVVQVQINDMADSAVKPTLLDGVMNGSGSSVSILQRNADFVGCDLGHMWNGTQCTRCACSNRTKYPGTAIRFIIET